MDTVTFWQYPPVYRQAVLSTLGHQLRSLKFEGCENIDLHRELLPCTRLEKLEFGVGCVFSVVQTLIEPFTSHLEILETRECLDLPSSFFEEPMPSLTELHLSCAHFGSSEKMEEYVEPIACNVSWTDIPRLYPNLKVISVGDVCASFTPNVLRLVASQFPLLQTISLSDMIPYHDADWQRLVDDLPSPIRLDFLQKYDDRPFSCSFHNNIEFNEYEYRM